MRHRASPQAPSTWKGRPGTLRGAAEATRETEEHAVDMDRLDERREEQRKKPFVAHPKITAMPIPRPRMCSGKISASQTHTATLRKDCIRRPRLTVS
jgi:hypothetical protein